MRRRARCEWREMRGLSWRTAEAAGRRVRRSLRCAAAWSQWGRRGATSGTNRRTGQRVHREMKRKDDTRAMRCDAGGDALSCEQSKGPSHRDRGGRRNHPNHAPSPFSGFFDTVHDTVHGVLAGWRSVGDVSRPVVDAHFKRLRAATSATAAAVADTAEGNSDNHRAQRLIELDPPCCVPADHCARTPRLSR